MRGFFGRYAPSRMTKKDKRGDSETRLGVIQDTRKEQDDKKKECKTRRHKKKNKCWDCRGFVSQRQNKKAKRQGKKRKEEILKQVQNDKCGDSSVAMLPPE